MHIQEEYFAVNFYSELNVIGSSEEKHTSMKVGTYAYNDKH